MAWELKTARSKQLAIHYSLSFSKLYILLAIPATDFQLYLFRKILNNFYTQASFYIFTPLMQSQTENSQDYSLRRIIIVALLFMLIGTGLELYLLDHYEDVFQLIPLLCIGSSVLGMIVLLIRGTKLFVGIFKLILGLTALSGFYGIYLHMQANYEFELEMKPTAKGWDLFSESLSGALPSLAPGSMIVLALIGYSYLILLKQKQ